MSFQACKWAIDQQVVTDPAARHVLVVMANYAGVDGKNVWPSSERLAIETGLSLRTVRYKIDLLEQAGLLIPGNEKILEAEGLRGDRRPKIFNLAMGINGVQDLQVVHIRGATDDTNDLQMTTPRGAAPAPNKVLNNQLKKVKRGSKGNISVEQWQESITDELIPDGHACRVTAKKIGLPDDFVDLALDEMIDRNTGQGPKYKDWGLALNNAIRGNWYRLWYQSNEDESWYLTTAGRSRQAMSQAEA